MGRKAGDGVSGVGTAQPRSTLIFIELRNRCRVESARTMYNPEAVDGRMILEPTMFAYIVSLL